MSTITNTQSVQSDVDFFPDDALDLVFRFLDPEDLGPTALTCKRFNTIIHETGQWKRQCEKALGVPDIDAMPGFPSSLTYKGKMERISSWIASGGFFGRRAYEDLLNVEVKLAPPIPANIFERLENPDPFEPTKTIRENYALMYRPSSVKTRSGEVDLTIKSLRTLMQCAGRGDPYGRFISLKILDQHGDKTMPEGWTLMRKAVVGRDLTFAEQQSLKNRVGAGATIPELLPRLVYNALAHAHSGEAKIYPDGQKPWTYARTSTLTLDEQGNAWTSACGAGGPSGLRVNNGFIVDDVVGVAVALPAEVQAIGP